MANSDKIVCGVSKNNETAKKIKTALTKNTKQATKNSATCGYAAYSKLRRGVVQLRASTLVDAVQSSTADATHPFIRLAAYKKTPAATIRRPGVNLGVTTGKYTKVCVLKLSGCAKRRVASINNLGFGVSRIISDVLQASGQKTIILLSEQPTTGASSNSKILKRLFISRFSRPVSRYKISAALLYKLILSLGESRDAETLLDFFKAALNKTHFPQHTGLFLLFSRALQYVWPFLKKELGARGLYISYSGKLSRHLLTKSRTLRLSVGKTGANTNNAVVYAYRQTWSETGAFGLSIYYYWRPINKTLENL